ncbi:hypothetical protein GIB67_002635 [Kingdonia uniflora]|uniref:Ribosomal RNA methyltransferase SPB1-like C-terminal domain-containing protein n=1 Tax=Kingdonia uniflora TaxID=39325 RepID=A0A7J7N4J5_9MAGN|nr:hypothetical protein GIB67_002635 [Kingdonia uniflora]
MPTQDEVTEQWFSQDIFIDAVKAKDLVKEESDDEMEDIKEEKIPKIAIPEKTLVKKTRDTVVSNLPKTQAFKSEQDFEIVPAPDTDSSDDSSSDESDLDDYEKAEVLACARRMLRKKQRDQIIDDGYNKYMFDDDNLPTWFIEEEKRHRQPTKPVTKEEINAMKAQFKEIDARPAKKVAQAKARKKRVTDRKLEKIRRKANTISDQTDIPEQSKGKMIEKLYKRAAPKRPKKEYVVAKKGVQVKAGKGKVLVDRRMKKDMRSNGSGRKGKGGSKGAKGGKDKKGAKSKGSSKPSARKGKMGNKGK